MPRTLRVLSIVAASTLLALGVTGCDDDDCTKRGTRTNLVSTVGFPAPPAPRPAPKAPDLPKVPNPPQAPYTPPQNNPALNGTPCD
jgi:hypothetical protein